MLFQDNLCSLTVPDRNHPQVTRASKTDRLNPNFSTSRVSDASAGGEEEELLACGTTSGEMAAVFGSPFIQLRLSRDGAPGLASAVRDLAQAALLLLGPGFRF